MQVQHTCPVCGSVFTDKRSAIRTFCSRTCKNSGQHRSPISDRFWSKVVCDLRTGCWLWTGHNNHPFGYGKLWIPGEVPRLTHRLSWELQYGPIPAGAYVLHTCDQPRCVRPDHLFLGDHAANMKDMFAKGRRHGEVVGSAKLTAEQVRSIRIAYAAGNVRQSDLATTYGISPTVIYQIVRGKTWRHI